MIYRVPYFIAVVWFGSYPIPFSPLFCQQVVSLSQSSCVSLLELTDGRDGGPWENLVLHNHSILSGTVGTRNRRSWQWCLCLPSPTSPLPQLNFLGDVSVNFLRVSPRLSQLSCSVIEGVLYGLSLSSLPLCVGAINSNHVELLSPYF